MVAAGYFLIHWKFPAKCSSFSNQHDKAETIDISFAKECSEEMVANMSNKFEISPSLREIVNHFDDDNKRPPDTFSFETKQAEEIDEPYDNGAEFNADTFDNGGTWNDDHDDQTNVANEGTYGGDPIMSSHYEVKEPTNFHDHDTDDRFAEIDDYLFLNLGFTSKLNAWAGPDHWKFRKVKGLENVSEDNGSPVITKKTKNKRQTDVDIDFLKCLDKDVPDVFAPPKNPKTLLLPGSSEPCNTTLPEDCHYQPENLVKLFLLPNVMCLGKSRRKSPAEMSHETDDYDNTCNHRMMILGLLIILMMEMIVATSTNQIHLSLSFVRSKGEQYLSRMLWLHFLMTAGRLNPSKISHYTYVSYVCCTR